MKDVLVPIVVAIIAALTGSGLVPLVQAVRGRGKARVDAVAELSATAHEWVERFESKAKTALDDAEAARTELHRVRQEARALADELQRLRLAILAPDANIDGLRSLVRRGMPT